MAESGWSFLMDGSGIDDGETAGLEDGGERCHLTGGGRLDVIHEIGRPDGFVFRVRVVEWEKTNGGNVFERGKKASHRTHEGFIGVEFWDYRNAYFDGDIQARETLEVFQNPFVSPAGVGTVEVRVGVLQVVEEKVSAVEYFFKCVPGNVATGVDGTMNIVLFQEAEDFGAEPGIQERLAAGDSATAVGIPVESEVFEYGSGDGFGGEFASIQFHHAGQASLDTFAAGGTDGMVELVFVFRKRMSADDRTDFSTCFAEDAAVFVKANLGFG